MVEFEIEGKEFRFDKLTAMEQFHVSRKIAPLIPPLLPVFQKIRDEVKENEEGRDAVEDIGALGPLLQPFADGLAQMSDEASEYVFSTCLGAIRYRHAGNWVQMWSTTGKVAMVVELNDASLLIRLVMRVITESLAPFISGLPMNAKGPGAGSRSITSPAEKTGS